MYGWEVVFEWEDPFKDGEKSSSHGTPETLPGVLVLAPPWFS